MKSKSFVFPKPDLSGDFVYRVPGQNIDSNCYFRFYRGVLDLLVLTELVDNSGALIIDSIEYLLPELRKYVS